MNICKTYGGYLVEIQSERENDLIKGHVIKYAGKLIDIFISDTTYK